MSLFICRDSPIEPDSSLSSSGSNNNSITADSSIDKRGDPPQWTGWTRCAQSGTIKFPMRHRYMKCKAHKDVRKCPKESVFCRQRLAHFKDNQKSIKISCCGRVGGVALADICPLFDISDSFVSPFRGLPRFRPPVLGLPRLLTSFWCRR